MTAEVAPERPSSDVRGPLLDKAYWRWVSTNEHAALASIFSKQGIWIARGLPLFFPFMFAAWQIGHFGTCKMGLDEDWATCENDITMLGVGAMGVFGCGAVYLVNLGDRLKAKACVIGCMIGGILAAYGNVSDVINDTTQLRHYLRPFLEGVCCFLLGSFALFKKEWSGFVVGYLYAVYSIGYDSFSLYYGWDNEIVFIPFCAAAVGIGIVLYHYYKFVTSVKKAVALCKSDTETYQKEWKRVYTEQKSAADQFVVVWNETMKLISKTPKDSRRIEMESDESWDI